MAVARAVAVAVAVAGGVVAVALSVAVAVAVALAVTVVVAAPRNDCDRKNWSRVRIPKTWIQFFLANLANYESLKGGAKDRNPLANNISPKKIVFTYFGV